MSDFRSGFPPSALALVIRRVTTFAHRRGLIPYFETGYASIEEILANKAGIFVVRLDADLSWIHQGFL